MLRLSSGTDKQDQAIAEALSRIAGALKPRSGGPHPAGGGAHCSDQPYPTRQERTRPVVRLSMVCRPQCGVSPRTGNCWKTIYSKPAEISKC